MRKTIHLRITDQEDGSSVKEILKAQGISRREVSRLKFQHGLYLNDLECRVTEVVHANDVLTIQFAEYDAMKLGYEEVHLDILYEDEDLVIVNKPTGIPVHPTHEYHDDLGTKLQQYYHGKNFTIRSIGRLDKDVSGIMCYAKNRPAAARLSKDRQDHLLQKTYYALCSGHFKEEKGTYTYHIQKVEGQRARQVGEEGQLCITNYEVLEQYRSFALVKIQIVTGRTHQIRAGFAYYYHPLLGDTLYGSTYKGISRVALHCGDLILKQPFTHKNIEIHLPLADDMKRCIKKEKELGNR